METFGGAVQVMLFVYAVAAVIALATAWIIKLIFYVIKLQHHRATASKSGKHAPAAATAKQPA